MYDVDAVDLLANKIDSLALRFDWLRTPNLGSCFSMVYKAENVC